MSYSKEDLEILKRSIEEYKIIKEEIDERIKGGYTLENLLDYIRHLSTCNITNYDLEDENFKYIDFNYADLTCSILQHNDKNNDKPYLGESIEVWNDKSYHFIGTFNNIREIEDILKEEE